MRKLTFTIFLFLYALSIKSQWNGSNPIWTNNFVGIGTMTPSGRIDIQSTITVQNVPDVTQKWSTTNNDYNLRLETLWNSGGINQNFIQKFAGIDYNVLSFYWGNVGIGNTLPHARLHIQANNTGTQIPLDIYGYRTVDGAGSWRLASISQLNTYGIGVLDIYNSALVSAVHLAADGNSYINPQNNGGVGIGTVNPSATLDVNGTIRTFPLTEGNPGQILIYGSQSGSKPYRIMNARYGVSNIGFEIWDIDAASSRLTIDGDGHVGIGTALPGNYQLNVSGTIRANEVVVNTSGADFVFDSDYKLPELSDIEKYVRENKHLPDIIPAAEMQKDGMSVSEMQTKLLQKIEELTLYSIEQAKIIKEQNERITKLESLLSGH